MFAQAPQRFTYQAVVRNESNTLVRGTVGVRVSILQGGVDGTVVYQETHTTTTNINGLMTLEIGGGTVVNGDFATIDWATGPYFLKTETDPDGGTNYTIEGTQQLLSVPYALYAGSAANSFSGDYNDLTNVPPMPQIPENVSAFNNDAGYITMDSIPEIPTVPTNVSAFTNDAGYITDTDVPIVPVNVSAFQNDAGYVTENELPSYQVLSISNDTLYLTNGGYVVLPAGFSGDYNDLTNPPQIPTVPTQVSAFTNDAGYITMDSVPVIPTVPTNVSAFENDANYITASDVPAVPTNVSAFTNDAGYITMDSIPAIPTVPTNVSAFVNDAGYVTESSLTNNNYITQNDLITNNYVTEADIPTNVSAFTNDAGYITMDSIPTITTVPTNVSAFVNDAGYLTTATVQEAANIPTNVSAFNNDAGYITMDSIPAIPTVPSNVSAFENDANYITSAAIPTAVSAFENDAHYLTSYTEQQVLTISNDTLFLTGGSFVKLPAGFDGNYNNLTNRPELFSGSYNDLTNKPQIPTVPTNVSAFTNDAGYITMDSVPTVPTTVSSFTNDAGYVTESMLTNNNYITQNDLVTNNYVTEADIPTNVSAFTNDAGYITMDSIPAIPTVPTNVSAFVNDAGYLTTATVQEAANIPTNVSVFNNDAGYITMDSIPAIPTVPTNVSAFVNDANYITNAAIPTAVSAFENDAHYLTEYTEQQVLTISNDTIYLTGGSFVKLPAGFDGDYNNLTNRPDLFSGNYNDLSNKPTIPTVPTNVSSFNNDANYITAADVPAIPANVSVFTNDAGYITMDSIPAIPTVPTNVSAFTNDVHYITTDDIPAYQVLSISNDTIYLSNGGYAVLPAGFDGNYNNLSNKPELFSGNYNDLTDKPTIPTVPTNVSAFTNDANYITSADVPAIPTNVSSFTNDAGYITMDSIPAIPTVPTNVSSFTNDANYITSADVPAIPTNVSSFTNDAGYITMDSIPAIPTVPTNVSSFTNDANYITNAAIPTAVSAFTNDAGYLTEYTEQQVLSISNDTIYLTGGSFAKLPAGFSGSYNDLTDRPDIPSIPTEVSTFNNDAGYLTRDSLSNYNLNPSDIQALLDRIEELEQTEVLPKVTTYIVSSSSDGILVEGNVYDPGSSSIIERGVCWGNTENPTLENNHISDERNSIGIFHSLINNLTDGETYYIRTYATNSAGTAYGPQKTISTAECPFSLTDYDGNTYSTILIGSQCWMKENLRTLHYANGTSVPLYTTPSYYPSPSATSAQCFCPNSDISNKPRGILYNWKAVMGNELSSTANPSGVQGICPDGWHVPSQTEWREFTNSIRNYCSTSPYLNPEYIAKPLASTSGWNSSSTSSYSPNMELWPCLETGKNNTTGFDAYPVGNVSPTYNGLSTSYYGESVYFWSTTQLNDNYVWGNGLYYAFADWRETEYMNRTGAYPVRCLKD